MIRSRWHSPALALALVVPAMALMPGAASAQFGGMGGGLVNPLPSGPSDARRVEVESISGKRVTGPLRLGSVAIDSDFGRFDILPEKIRAIRFEVPEGHPGMHVVAAGGYPSVQVPGVLVTASGEEMEGELSFSSGLGMTTDLGPLTLDPYRLRSITFLPDDDEEDDPAPDAYDAPAAEDAEPEFDPTGTPTAARRNAPEPYKINDLVWAVSPSGDRVAVRDLKSGKTARLDLPASEESPLFVVPVIHSGLIALHLEGPTIHQLAVLDTSNQTWYPLELAEPVSAKASPIVNTGVAVYNLGRNVHAFSTRSNRWATLTLDLPDDAQVLPEVMPDTVTVRHASRIHTFGSETGEWSTLDLGELLGDLLDDPADDDQPEGDDPAGDDGESPDCPE